MEVLLTIILIVWCSLGFLMLKTNGHEAPGKKLFAAFRITSMSMVLVFCLNIFV